MDSLFGSASFIFIFTFTFILSPNVSLSVDFSVSSIVWLVLKLRLSSRKENFSLSLNKALFGGDGDTNRIEVGDSGAAAAIKKTCLIVVVVVVVVVIVVVGVATI